MTRAAAIAAVVAALVAAPRIAAACGGGGSDSGSSSGSSGGSSDSSDSSSSSSEPACVEVSGVVGRSQCAYNRFGLWNVQRLPRISLRLGTSVHRFAVDDMTFEGSAPHDDGIAYRMVGGELTDDLGSAVTFDLGATFRIGRYLYAGAETKVGKAMVDTHHLERDSGLSIDPSATLYIEAGAVTGIAVPIGNISLRAEALFGRRMLGFSVQSSHADCVDRSFAYDSEWLVEPRVSAETWLGPWASVGVQVGANALADRDMSVGVFIKGHTRAFDATRSR